MSDRHRIVLGGITLVPDTTGALYAPDFRTLLAADLHLEQGASLARRGLHVPPFDTPATLAMLEDVIARTRPWRLVLLGDSFHDAVAHGLIDHPYTERLRRITGAVETVWITGNHDPAPPVHMGGTSVSEHHLEHVVLRHIPARRLDGGHEIAGHLHPGATIVQRGVATRAKCFAGDSRRLILPAFGAYTGAVNIRSRAFTGLLDEATTSVWMLARSGIHAFPMRRCG